MTDFDPFDDEIVLSSPSGLDPERVIDVVRQIPFVRIRTEPTIGRNPLTGKDMEIPAGPADIQLHVAEPGEEWTNIGGLTERGLVLHWYYGELDAPHPVGQKLLEFVREFCRMTGATNRKETER